MNSNGTSEPSPAFAPNFKGAANFSRLFFDAWALTTTVFMRHGFGSRFLGRRAVLGLAIAFVYPALWPHDNPVPLFVFFGLLVVMLVKAEASILRRAWRGEYIHSLYNGEPRLMRVFPRLSEMAIKRWVEPLVVVLGGVVFLPLSQPLAIYLILAGLCMRTAMKNLVRYERTKAQDSFDAMADAQQHAVDVRAMRR